VLELRVVPGSEQALIGVFRTAQVFHQAERNEGFLGAELLVPEEKGAPLLVIARWSDVEAIQRWIADPARERVNRRLEPLLTEEPVRRTYSVAVSGHSSHEQPPNVSAHG
jgi:heme-degrading monooxygenase HmoA